jgi:hypothetical protein
VPERLRLLTLPQDPPPEALCRRCRKLCVSTPQRALPPNTVASSASPPPDTPHCQPPPSPERDLESAAEVVCSCAGSRVGPRRRGQRARRQPWPGPTTLVPPVYHGRDRLPQQGRMRWQPWPRPHTPARSRAPVAMVGLACRWDPHGAARRLVGIRTEQLTGPPPLLRRWQAHLRPQELAEIHPKELGG